MKFLYIFTGGGLGALSRYLVALFVQNKSGKTFPVGTLSVNLIGCFIIGLLFGLAEKLDISPNLRVFIFVGFLGGFTTFSSFGLETYNLLKQTSYKFGILNIFLNNFFGVILVYIGYLISNLIKR